jgi:hypothetical protein
VTLSKGFRHGDIENALHRLVKNASKSHSGGGVFGHAMAKLSGTSGGGGKTFNSVDIKHVYFVGALS